MLTPAQRDLIQSVLLDKYPPDIAMPLLRLWDSGKMSPTARVCLSALLNDAANILQQAAQDPGVEHWPALVARAALARKTAGDVLNK